MLRVDTHVVRFHTSFAERHREEGSSSVAMQGTEEGSSEQISRLLLQAHLANKSAPYPSTTPESQPSASLPSGQPIDGALHLPYPPQSVFSFSAPVLGFRFRGGLAAERESESERGLSVMGGGVVLSSVIGHCHLFAERRVHQATRLHSGSTVDSRARVGDSLHEDYAGDCMSVSGNVDVNADYVFNDVASGIGPSTGPQRHDTRMDAMNRVRDMMADDMWDIFQSASWYKTT
ncbi:hypothetical protein TIFTF001_012800 [Ficus carica]|uniref:Uncharacterized protein n=1 Tax=Ficus carica TaxID=3494 RepID=A0AA88A0Y0_FICCA|nr:hypothetical protein TIFTF001_012800 [Ficus carica]